MADQLAGAYAALLSGFADDGAFDSRRQRNILDYVTTQDIAGLYAGGSSAEEGLMDTDELLEQQQIVVDYAKNLPLKLIAHVGRPGLPASVKLAKSAEKLGFHALSALPPHAYPFSDDEIFAYYKDLSEASALPLIVYEVPERTQRPFSFEGLSEILALPGVAGMKFTSTDLFKMSRIKAAHPEKLVFFGCDEIAAAGALLGAEGGIGTTYNVMGGLYTALFRAVETADIAKARGLQCVSQRFVAILLKTGVVAGCKLALQAAGIDCGPARAPFQVRSADGAAQVRAFMAGEAAPWIPKPGA